MSRRIYAVEMETEGELSESRDFYDRLGPWVPDTVVSSALGVALPALDQQRRDRQLLGVEFGGRFYYPALQFTGGRVVDGLPDVLAALSSGFVSAEAQASWLAEPAYNGRSETRWDVLRSDPLIVVEWAAADARAGSSP